MQDISSDIYESDIDNKDPEISRDIFVVKDEKEPLIDISSIEQSDISLQKKHHINVSQKNDKKYFDSLEKKSKYTSFLQKKNIDLRGKKEYVQFGIWKLYVSRFFKSLSVTGKILTGCAVIFGILFLGYIDKVFVENRVNAGYQKLLDIRGGHLGLEGVQKKVNNSRFDFILADIGFIPFKVLPGEKIQSVKHVISGGKYLSRSLDNILSLYEKVDGFIEEKSLNKIYFTQLFLNISPELQNIEASLKKSLYHYKNITWLPNKYLEEKRQGSVIKIEKLLGYVENFNNDFSTFLDILGHSERKRYLLVFQNSDEIRPTGGFMGSMGLLEIFKGRIQLFQKKDVYAIEWDLKKSEYKRLPAPKGIDQLTEKFGLRDANYYANLKDSSNTIKFFTDQAGIDLDGIIYINQNILLHLLDITGPVYFKALDKEITSENFSEIMSLVVEAKTFKKGTLGTPKQVLFDFMEVFSQKLISNGEYFDYMQSLIHDVEGRDIMMWSFNKSENKFLSEMKVNGQLEYDETLDFAYPVYTSLSGNKSDRYMRRTYIQKVTSVANSCAYDIELEMQSTHTMGKRKKESIQELIDDYKLDTKNLMEIQGAGTNKQFVRIILPSEAQINSSKNMEIVDYGTRKGLEFFINTQVQETSYRNIKYTLPNIECKKYSYKLYKQPGILEYDIEISIDNTKNKYQGRQEDFYFEHKK